MAEDCLILVNYRDEQIGQGYKLEVHKKGLLHRAFSVFLYDGNKLLIQKRASNKYHSAGLWANTCCSHPRVGEKLEMAVQRRLLEEVGVSCDVKHLNSFVYREVFDELSEYELDHIFVGEYKGGFVCKGYGRSTTKICGVVSYSISDGISISYKTKRKGILI